MAMNNNYSAEVGIKFNDTRLKSQLKTIESKTINLNLQLSRGTSTQINSINKALNKMKITTSSTVAEMNALGDRTTVAMKNVKRSVDTTSKSIEGASKHAHTLGSKFVDITKKVIAFGAITSAIGLFTQAMSQAVKVVGEFDASLTELKKVSDLSGDGLEEYTQKAYSMARELSTSATNITDATTAFVQAGYSIDESTGLSKYAIMLQSIADETMETEVATNFLTSTMKAFNLTASDAEHIISAVNETSNQYALTSNDLSENMGKVAGVAGIAGVSMEQLIGLMTASIEKTRNASKSANAFKSIFINLQQMNDSGTLPKLSKKFDDFGISMTESNGKIKSAYDLLHELADAYKQVSNSTDVDKQNKMRTLLEDIGGKYNYNVLISSLTGFDTAISATNTALNSTGSAQKEFDKSLDSIQKRLEALQGAFLELVNGDGGFAKFLKFILSSVTNILKFTNATGGMQTILLAIGGILGTILIPKMASFVVGIGNAISAMKTMAITAETTQLAFGGVLAVITLVSIGYSVMAQNAEEAKQAQEELYQANLERYKQATDTLEKLKSEKLTRIELLQIVNGFSEAYGREVDAIKNTDDARKKSIELIEAEKKAKAQSIIDTSMSKYKEAKSGLSASGTIDVADTRDSYEQYKGGALSPVTYSGIEDKLKKLIELKDKFMEISENTKNDTNALGISSKEHQVAEQAVKDYETQIANTMAQNAKFHQSISDVDNALTAVGKTYDTSKNKVRDLTDGEKLLGRASANVASQEDKHAESQKALASAEKSRVDGLQSVSDSIDSIQSAYTILDDAVSEYNKTGNFSLDTLQSLMSLSPDYLSMLEMQNGKLVLNEKAMRKKIAASLEEGKQLIWNTAAEKLNALEKQSNAVISINSASDWIEYQNQIRNTTTELNKNSGAEAYNKALKSTASTDVDQKKRQKIINDTKSQIKLLNSATAGIKSRSTAIVENTDNTKKESSAIDKSIDKLEKKKDKLDALKDRYSSLFEAIQDAYDLEIDKLEESKDASEEVRQTNIDYLNTLIDKENDLIDVREKESESEIDRLEKKKKAQDDYYDNELSKLEKTNDEQNKSLELQEKQEALAKAKSQRVMVYDKGEWKYIQDQGAVETARKELQSTITSQELEKQKDAIESLKDASDESYDRQIENQENLLKEYQKAHEGVISNLENLINAEETAQKKEDKIYETKIKNIKNLKESVEKLSNKYQDLANVKLINKYLDGDTNDLSQISKIASTYTKLQKTIAAMQSSIDKKNDKKDNSTSKKKSSRSSSAIGQEVRGNISSFDRSGVNYVNADSSINNILTSNKSPINRINTSTNYASRSTTTSQSFHFDKIELPNVNNAESFVSSLSSKFNNYVIQKTNSFG